MKEVTRSCVFLGACQTGSQRRRRLQSHPDTEPSCAPGEQGLLQLCVQVLGCCCVLCAEPGWGSCAVTGTPSLGLTGSSTADGLSKAAAKSCRSFPPKRWGNSSSRLTVLLQVTFLKKHTNKIMVGCSLTGLKRFLVIH